MNCLRHELILADYEMHCGAYKAIKIMLHGQQIIKNSTKCLSVKNKNLKRGRRNVLYRH